MKTLNLYLLLAQYRERLYPWARGTFGGYIAVKVDASENVSNFFTDCRYSRSQDIYMTWKFLAGGCIFPSAPTLCTADWVQIRSSNVSKEKKYFSHTNEQILTAPYVPPFKMF